MAARIRLLMPYFGRWPKVFPLYLDSVRRNPNLEVLFFTDNAWPDPLPPNIAVVRLSFADVLSLAARKLGVAVAEGVRPIKLCDFRPAFGVVFEDYLKDVEFWGHGDIDVIYGQASTFLTRERLDAFDVISFRNDWIHGPFTLYRNTPAVNHLFKGALDHRRHFEERRYVNFDECLGQHERLEEGTDPYLLEPRPVSMTGLVRAAARDGRLRLHTEMAIVEKLPHGRSLAYHDGAFTDDDEKGVVFYHLFREKKLSAFSYPSWRTLPSAFHVTETGFYSSQQFRWRRLLSPLRRARGVVRFILSIGPRLHRRIRRRAAARLEASSSQPRGTGPE